MLNRLKDVFESFQKHAGRDVDLEDVRLLQLPMKEDEV